MKDVTGVPVSHSPTVRWLVAGKRDLLDSRNHPFRTLPPSRSRVFPGSEDHPTFRRTGPRPFLLPFDTRTESFGALSCGDVRINPVGRTDPLEAVSEVS